MRTIDGTLSETVPGGVGRVVVSAALCNKGTEASSPPRRGPLGRSRGAFGGSYSWIFGSGEFCFSQRDCCGGGANFALEFLYPVPVFVAARFGLALLRGFWGCCRLRRLVLRSGVGFFVVGRWWSWRGWAVSSVVGVGSGRGGGLAMSVHRPRSRLSTCSIICLVDIMYFCLWMPIMTK